MHLTRPTSSVGRRFSLFTAALLTAIVVLATTSSQAPALSLGLHWNGNPDQTQSESELELVQRSGASFFYVEIARQRGLSYYEPLFDRAAKRGITLIPQLMWGKQYPLPGADGQYGGWGAWVQEAVQKYGPGGTFWIGKSYARPATTWEVWNEPNLPEYNPGGEKAQPENYGRFFVFTSNAIHAVQPSAQVLLGGLYLGHWNEPQMEEFVSKVYSISGMASAVNGVSIHPYGFTQGSEFAEFANEVINIRTVLNRRPQGSSEPLWITELGWPVAGEGQPLVDPPTQAKLLRQSFNWTKSVAGELNIQGLTWYTLSDNNVNNWAYHCGLVDLNGSFRESWWEFQQQTGAEVWPRGPWGGDNLGGSMLSDPTISSQGPGQLNVFARGSDNALWHRWYSGGAWSGWQSLGGNLSSGPGAVSWGPNRIDVVARGGDNAVWHWAWNGVGWSLESLGGTLESDPEISSQGPGQLNVFVRGVDNVLWHKWYSGDAWSGWQSLGGNLSSGPGAVSWGPNRIDVVARGGDNAVWHWAWNGVGWSLGSLGGSVASAPDISSLGPGYLDLFVRGGSTLWHRSYNGVWGGWEDLGGVTTTSGPGAVSWSNTRTDVVRLTSNGSIARTFWSP